MLRWLLTLLIRNLFEALEHEIQACAWVTRSIVRLANRLTFTFALSYGALDSREVTRLWLRFP